MAKLTIIKESKAARCEVCHQADLFDSTTNTCERCGNLSSINQSAVALSPPHFQQFPLYQPQVIIPKNVAIEELGETFTIAYKSGSVKNLVPFLALSFNIFNFFLRPHGHNPVFMMLMAISLIAILFGFINLVIKKTYLTITNDQIIKRDFPNLGFTNKTINIKDIVDFEFSEERGREKLSLRLNDGKRVRLISNRGDRDGMDFIERVLKERLAKKRV